MAGVAAFGLSEAPEDILDPLAALLYGQHSAWRYRDRDFFYRPFSYLFCLMAWSAGGGWSMSSVTSCTGSAGLDVYDGMI